MNDEPRKPLGAVGDEELEARVVAWVLGEASAFEAEELEERCVREPELRLFAERMRAVHGLIGENLGGDPGDSEDGEWRLPEAKRRQVVDLLGVEAPPGRVVEVNWRRRITLALAACLVACLMAWPLIKERSDRSWSREAIAYHPVASEAGERDRLRKGLEPVPGQGSRVAGESRAWYGREQAGEEARAAVQLESAPATVLGRDLVEGLSEDRFDRPDPGSEGRTRPRRATRELDAVLGVADLADRKHSADAIPPPMLSEANLSELEPAGEPARGNDGQPGRAAGLGRLEEVTRAKSEFYRAAYDETRAELLAEVDHAWGLAAPAEAGPSSAPTNGPVKSRELADREVASRAGRRGGVAGNLDDGSSDANDQAADAFALVDGVASEENFFFKRNEPGMEFGVNSGTKSAPVDDSISGPAGASLGSRADLLFDLDGDGGSSDPFAGSAEGAELSLGDGGLDTPKGRWADAAKETVNEKAAERRLGLALGESTHDFSLAGGSINSGGLAPWGDEDESEPLAAEREQGERGRDSWSSGGRGEAERGQAALAKKPALPDRRPDSSRSLAQQGLVEADKAPADVERLARLPAEVEELESKSDSLGFFYGGQPMTYAAGVPFSDDLVTRLEPRYLEAQRKLEVLKQSGLGPDHPEVARQEEQVDRMRREIGDEIAVVRESIRAKQDQAGAEPAPALRLLERESDGIEPAAGKALDLMAEVSAGEEPYSTFSLHVGDASFQLAAAAVGRGEMPEPARVRPEEFYNAFDYGDPTPAPGEPVACVVEQCAHPVFPQRNLMRIAVRTGSEGRDAQRRLNLTLMFDNSGSMEREDRATGVSRAVEQLAGLLGEDDRVSVVGFARQPRLLEERIAGSEAERLNALVDQLPAEGGTNLEQALGLAEELALRHYDADGENRVVLFTDGAANLGDADPESLNRRVERMRQNGIAFDAAGFGAAGLNDRLLERLTRNGNGRYYLVDQPEDADEGFARKLAGAFRPGAENVKVQLRFNPERVGRYKLIGFDEHRLEKEDFRNDAVDAAEMASEEAGVALYQFEVDPEGHGEVGEVSVRFRDAASGRMVERRWTIPYDEQAPAFDRAAESLQLAGLAAMAAEKFRGAPMAEAIEFGDLGQVVGQVKGRYGASGRVEELERMIEALR